MQYITGLAGMPLKKGDLVQVTDGGVVYHLGVALDACTVQIQEERWTFMMEIQEQMTKVQKVAGLLAGKTRKVKLSEMTAPEDYSKALALVKEAGIKSRRGHYAWQRWQPEFRRVKDLLEKAGI